MPGKAAVFDILVGERTPAVDHALVTALQEADPPTAQMIVDALLVRNHRVGLYGLVAAFQEFDESIRQHVLGHMNELFGVLRGASQSRVKQVRLNALELIRRGCAYRAAYLVDAALHDRSAQVREAAAETLYTLADQLLRTSPVADLDIDDLDPDEMRSRMAQLESYAEDRRQVVGAIESGLASFGLHLHPSVVEAAMWFVDDLGVKFWAVVSAPGSRAARVAISIISGSKNPRLVPFSIMALNYVEFRPHVAKVLGTCTDAAFLAEWLRQSWRVVQSRTARGLAALRQLTCIRNRAAALMQLPADAQRHIPRCISAAGICKETKLDALKELLRRGHRRARRAAAWALIPRTDERATSQLRALARGDCPELARIAQYELARRRPLEYPPCELISMPDAGSHGESVWGGAEAPATFDKYWATFDQLSEEEGRYFGERILAQDSSAQGILGRRLTESEPADRVRALRIITVLGVAAAFADQLYQMSHDNHPEIRSTAVKALGQLENGATRRILRGALADDDPRVQANAVEAVECSGSKFATSELLSKLASPDNRVRANAVKALLKLGVRQAAETLLVMLEDPSRAQRISALWLIDNMGLFTLAARIVKIAESDDDEQVRERAKTLADRLPERQPTPGPTRNANPEVAPSLP